MEVPPYSILVGFSIIDHPAIGVPPFQETTFFVDVVICGSYVKLIYKLIGYQW